MRPRRPNDLVRARDAALSRIARTRRWVLAGAAGLTAGLAALVSVVLPGKSLGAKSKHSVGTAAAPASRGSSVTPPLPAPADASQLGVGSQRATPQALTPPPSAPAPEPNPQAAPEAAPAPAPAPEPAPAPSGGGAAVSGGS